MSSDNDEIIPISKLSINESESNTTKDGVDLKATPPPNHGESINDSSQTSFHQDQSTSQSNPQPTISRALNNALFSAKDRPFVLSLEEDIISFISSNTDSYLLKPMNSYYRLLTHQVAEYYSLGHTLTSEGTSIIVFKSFGVELTKPTPLSSLTYDPNQFAYQQYPPTQNQYYSNTIPQRVIPQQTTIPGVYPGFVPQSFGYPPYQFQSVHQHHVQSPYSQHPHIQYPSQNRPVQQNQYSQEQNHQHQQQQPLQEHQHEYDGNGQTQPQTSRSLSSSTVEESKESEKTTPKEFKLMKRKPIEKSNGETSQESINNEQDETIEDAKDKESSDISKDPAELESERASRESLYQKARERIFQSNEEGEEEEDDEEKEDKDAGNLKNEPLIESLNNDESVGVNTNGNSNIPDIPRDFIPQQPPYQFQTQIPPGYPSIIPQQPYVQQFYQYPIQFNPGFDSNKVLNQHQGYNQYNQQQPQYQPQQSYTGNYRGKPHHYNNQGYRKQRNNNGNGGYNVQVYGGNNQFQSHNNDLENFVNDQGKSYNKNNNAYKSYQEKKT